MRGLTDAQERYVVELQQSERRAMSQLEAISSHLRHFDTANALKICDSCLLPLRSAATVAIDICFFTVTIQTEVLDMSLNICAHEFSCNTNFSLL